MFGVEEVLTGVLFSSSLVSIIASLRISAGDSSVLQVELDKSEGIGSSRGTKSKTSGHSMELTPGEGETSMAGILDSDLEFAEEEGSSKV